MRLKEVSDKFQAISLKEMDAVELLNRVDTKYMLNAALLPVILDEIVPYYKILEINKERVFEYISLYYDSLRNNMYFDHHNGRLNRYKVRFRRYVSSDLYKLEVKFKKKGTRTIKSQKIWDCIEDCLSNNSKSFIRENSPYDGDDLIPVIYTQFRRMTLVNNNNGERATIDIDLKFRKADHEKLIGNLSLIEVKRSLGSGFTELMSVLKKYGIRQKGFSKYCIGRALMEPALKQNRFKEKLLIINKINDDKFNHIGTQY